MRIAVVTELGRLVGGTEQYIERIIRYLAEAGHDVLLFYAHDVLKERRPIEVPAGTTVIAADAMGERAAIERLRDWAPDVSYAHGLLDASLSVAAADVAPSVFFAHNYHGTCISGAKTFTFPTARPCSRRFGPACLALYYPRRTGGLSPLTMLRDYGVQSERLRNLRRHRIILTFSEHMRQEYLRHGFAPDVVRSCTFPLAPAAQLALAQAAPLAGPARPDASGTLRLLFVGRMDWLKGAHYLVDALPAIRSVLERPVSLVLAGDGQTRAALEEQARRITSSDPETRVTFAGWVDSSRRAELLAQTDLFVLPSLWPEPFGIVGLEAALAGVPTAAFDVGGARSWLGDGVTGVLAPSDPPTVDGLAAAIARAASDPRELARLGAGALRSTAAFSAERHVDELLEILEEARSEGRGPAGARRQVSGVG